MRPMTNCITIGRLAQAAAVNVETVRYYQRRGLVSEPVKPLGGQRRYPPEAVKRVQFINRSTNTVAGTKRKGVQLLVGGTEAGAVDLYMLGSEGYQLVMTTNVRELTGFTGSEDIEIRSLWVDGLDNLVFAASSWGNDQSRSLELPSFFVFEIR